MRALNLFLVSAAALGLETALTRYFALSSWSDYGYWVISIVMAGFAFSGVALAVGGSWVRRYVPLLLSWLPALLTLSAALGYEGVVANPFNPLSLQNPTTYLPQLGLIGLYYAALLPYFCLTGLFISLCFVEGQARIGRVYAADLLGAAAGSAYVLALMYGVPAFTLIYWLLPLPALAALFAPARRGAAGLGALAALALGYTLLLLGPQAAVSQYKPVFAPLHTPGAQQLATLTSPRGEYWLLADFTERVNTDISNDSAMLGYPDPPRALGLYRDGVRIASLPLPGPIDSGYAKGALDALPYTLRPHATSLLIGASGGFRIAELSSLGAARVTALEPDPVLYGALMHGLGPSPAYPLTPGVTILPANPRAFLRHAQDFDVVDLSADFLDQSPANSYDVSAEALAADLAALTPGGVLSVPVSIQDFPAYALRMLSTVNAALRLAHAPDPAAQIILYRSAWNARILVSNQPFSAADIARATKWCDDRSFDVSFYKGFDAIKARDNLYNDLPAVSFTNGTQTALGDDDSLADEAPALLAGEATASSAAFDLRPVTDDRPAFYAVLRLNRPGLLWARIQILPQAEIGALVNLAVAAQAVLIALLVLIVPLVFRRGRAGQGGAALKGAFYFPALALGFLFIELFAIERASLVLDDRALAFAIVLSVLLGASGVGALMSGRLAARPRVGVVLAVVGLALWAGLVVALQGAPVLALAGLPVAARVAVLVLLLAPAGVLMGLPFPLGLTQFAADGFFLPWAWGLNGAFSVLATPLANLLLRNIGLHAVLCGAVVLYGLAALSFPAREGQKSWYAIFRRSAAAA
ncbi:hypothetical protein [Acidocella sp.]|uniref:hypothetical protein n=1 Tax=Acidocella sp. TaxID=50710 RepID=UPI0026281A77|nr:hypothetical protein [Acidocella sp.]